MRNDETFQVRALGVSSHPMAKIIFKQVLSMEENIVNKRIEKLRTSLMSTNPEICPERARYFTESLKQSEGEPIVLRRANGLYDVLDNMSIYVGEGELIVGNQASKPKASPIYPEYSINWLESEFNGDPYHFYERPGDKFYYTEETKDEILSLIDY